VTYDGEWRNGKRCGRGKKFFGDGQYFLGTFHNDAMWGEGVLFYENGAPAFVGEYRNDKRNGEGVAYDIGGEVVEKGFYVNDVCVISAMERYRVCYKQLILHYVTGLAVAR
jgi:singapore isolate B (sub-type 7) whole genome shotgun sequence assembly, scaffold_0